MSETRWQEAFAELEAKASFHARTHGHLMGALYRIAQGVADPQLAAQAAIESAGASELAALTRAAPHAESREPSPAPFALPVSVVDEMYWDGPTWKPSFRVVDATGTFFIARYVTKAIADFIASALNAYGAREGERERLRRAEDAVEMAWGVIANVSGGDWSRQTQEWFDAAARWRDEHLNPVMAEHRRLTEGGEHEG